MHAKGRGLARGLSFESGEMASKVCRAAFDRCLLMETSGPEGEVAKVMPPLTITDDELSDGLDRLVAAVHDVCA
jgi:diaminobutyrate-2-oxoglutarate transaminase